jgi:hypothetical protein
MRTISRIFSIVQSRIRASNRFWLFGKSESGHPDVSIVSSLFHKDNSLFGRFRRSALLDDMPDKVRQRTACDRTHRQTAEWCGSAPNRYATVSTKVPAVRKTRISCPHAEERNRAPCGSLFGVLRAVHLRGASTPARAGSRLHRGDHRAGPDPCAMETSRPCQRHQTGTTRHCVATRFGPKANPKKAAAGVDLIIKNTYRTLTTRGVKGATSTAATK